MKRIGQLFDQITARENVAAAVWRASRGKRERKEIVAFDFEWNSGTSMDQKVGTIVPNRPQSPTAVCPVLPAGPTRTIEDYRPYPSYPADNCFPLFFGHSSDQKPNTP